jgi:aerobic C4-dicarboxylate transport protein
MSTAAITSPVTALVRTGPASIFKSLFVQVLIALLLGVALGVMTPDFAISLKILSDAFLKLISMIVAPIVFCVVVHGIAGAGDLKKVGRVGVKALVYFEVMTTVALVFGITLAFLFGPGHGMNIDTSALDPKALSTYADNAHKLQGGGIGGFILNIIPTTSIDALSRNDVLQVLFFAVLFGVALALVGEKGEKVTSLIDAVSTVLFSRHGPDRSDGPARCAGSGCLHGWQIRRRLTRTAIVVGCALLRRTRSIRHHHSRPRHAVCGV